MSTIWKIQPLPPGDDTARQAVGQLLRAVKPDRDPSPLIAASLAPDALSLIATDARQRVGGWLWGRPLFEGRWAWELRWLVVDSARRRQGIGQLLTTHFEDWCREHGILTIWLMTGEEMGATSLRGASLWHDPLTSLGTLEPVEPHAPVHFWRRMGYRFIGVIPDANGPGVPEYLMGKSLL